MKSLTSWLDLGILEATHLKTFESNESWIAEHLNVNVLEVREAIEKLLEIELLKINEEGIYEDLSPFFSTTDGIPSPAIRQFHISVLNKVQYKILKEDVDQRVAKTVIFSLEENQISEAKAIFKRSCF